MKHTLTKNILIIVKYQSIADITGAVLINPSKAPKPSGFLCRRELLFDTCLFYGYFKIHVAPPYTKMSTV